MVVILLKGPKMPFFGNLQKHVHIGDYYESCQVDRGSKYYLKHAALHILSLLAIQKVGNHLP